MPALGVFQLFMIESSRVSAGILICPISNGGGGLIYDDTISSFRMQTASAAT